MHKFPNSHLIRALIIDMDGVLWRGSQPIGDLPYLFKQFKRHDLQAILATNNPTLTADQYVEKLRNFGAIIEKRQVITSAQATAQYLGKQHPQGGPVYVIGEEGLLHTLAENGFFSDEDRALAVVVSLDRDLDYEKLRRASLLIRSGVPFIATNTDCTLPSPEGFVPGAGSIVAAIQAATDTPPIVIGKPQPDMYRAALDRLEVTPGETLVIGDRLETDIAGGQALGCYTALVLSGATTEEAARSWKPAPDIVVSDLTSLLDCFKN